MFTIRKWHALTSSIVLCSLATLVAGCGGDAGQGIEPSDAATPVPYADGIATVPTLISDRSQPDRLLFSADQEGGGNYEIYSVLPNGTDLVRLTANTAADTGATYSPDRTLIAFARTEKRGVTSGTLQTYLFNPNRVSSLYIMGRYGENPRKIYPSDTATAPKIKDQHRFVSFPRFSPDGKRVLFFRTAVKDDESFNTFLSLVDVETGRSVDVVAGIESGGGPPAWSLDGELIAFSQKKDGKYRIYTVKRDGQAVTAVTDPPIVFGAGGTILATDNQTPSDSSPVFTPPTFPGEPSLLFSRRLLVPLPDGSNENRSQIYRVPLSNLKESAVQAFAPSGRAIKGESLCFSPTGDRIALVNDQKLRIVSATTGEETVLNPQSGAFYKEGTLLETTSWFTFGL